MNTLTMRNRFPQVAAIALGAAVVVGFTRTYYLRFLSDLPPMTLLVHVHGALCSAWLIMHFTQARLIAARNARLHRKLGLLTALIGLTVVGTGGMVSLAAAARGHAPPGRDPVDFLTVSLGTTLMFALFLVGGLAMRKHAEWHKRLMLLATMVFLVPAIGRLDGYAQALLGWDRGRLPLVVSAMFMGWACVNDLQRRGRIHPAYLSGGSLLLVAIPLRAWLGTTAAWEPIGQRLLEMWRSF